MIGHPSRRQEAPRWAAPRPDRGAERSARWTEQRGCKHLKAVHAGLCRACMIPWTSAQRARGAPYRGSGARVTVSVWCRPRLGDVAVRPSLKIRSSAAVSQNAACKSRGTRSATPCSTHWTIRRSWLSSHGRAIGATSVVEIRPSAPTRRILSRPSRAIEVSRHAWSAPARGTAQWPGCDDRTTARPRQCAPRSRRRPRGRRARTAA